MTVFDPALPGTDYILTVISGASRPSVNENNPYFCIASTNPSTTGYQWLAAQVTNGDLADSALHGLTNFTISPTPPYSIITNPPVGSGNCFHLAHTNPIPQFAQLSATSVSQRAIPRSVPESLLSYATSNEVARVQISTNDERSASWVDIYLQKGTGGSPQTAFASHTLSLSNCAGQITYVRFNYDYAGGAYHSQSSAMFGWCLERILITNAVQLVNITTISTVSTNFNFVPHETGDWVLEARGVIFDEFGLGWSPATQLTVVTNTAPTLILLGSPAIIGDQVQIPLTVPQGAVSSFILLQASQITGPWTTNADAVLSSLVTGTSFQFTTAYAGSALFPS